MLNRRLLVWWVFVFPVCLEFGCVKEKRVGAGFLTVVVVLLQADVVDGSC